jgi:predicted  nucleic acid-binding Zn-ribbon protein
MDLSVDEKICILNKKISILESKMRSMQEDLDHWKNLYDKSSLELNESRKRLSGLGNTMEVFRSNPIFMIWRQEVQSRIDAEQMNASKLEQSNILAKSQLDNSEKNLSEIKSELEEKIRQRNEIEIQLKARDEVEDDMNEPGLKHDVDLV